MQIRQLLSSKAKMEQPFLRDLEEKFRIFAELDDQAPT